jgi:hypothetical protein
MTGRSFSGLFIAEGSSDFPLSDTVELLFFDRGVRVHLSRPDFASLDRVARDVRSRVSAGIKLAGQPVDLIVVHRDADRVGRAGRCDEIAGALSGLGASAAAIPLVPVKMTEAWLLLDEAAIRIVAGNPRGTVKLNLPQRHEVEGVADPKAVLKECLLVAADATGRRRAQVANRFPQHRRQLLERLDRFGPVGELPGWKSLIADIEEVADRWKAPYE